MKRFLKVLGCVCVIAILLVACKDKQESQIAQKRDIFAYTLITTSTQDSNPTQDFIQSFIIEVLDQPSERLAFYPAKDQNTPKNDIGKSIFEEPKPTIVLFVQDECQNCLTQTPYIIQLKEKYASQINLLILAAQPQSTGIDEVLKSHHKSYPIYAPSDSQNLLEFLGKDISQGYLALFDTEGNKVIDYAGLTPPEMLERDILFLIHDRESHQIETDLGTTESTQDSQATESTQENEDTQPQQTREVTQDSQTQNP